METKYDPLRVLTDLYGEDLATEQLRLEAEAYELGEKRFLDAMEFKTSRGLGGDTKVARPMIADLLPKLSMRIIEFIGSQQNGKPGKKATAFKLIYGLDPDRIAFLTLRTLLNHIHLPKGCTVQLLCASLGKAIEEEARFGRIRDLDRKNYEGNIAVNIKKRGSDHFKRSYASAVEQSMREAGELTEWDHWGVSNRMAVGLKMVELMIELGLVELVDENAGDAKKHVKKVQLAEDFDGWLQERLGWLSGTMPAWSPCVVPPKPWTGMRQGGYWGRGRSNPKFIRGLGRRGYARYADVDLGPVMKAVNIIQNTPWTINKEVLRVAREVLEWGHMRVKDMPSPNCIPKPPRLEGMDDDPKILKRWKRSAVNSSRAEKARRTRRAAIMATLAQADKVSNYERIWFPYNLDFRSRVYALTSAISPQGSDLAKGLLLLADASPMGDSGEYWLRMHIANVAGLDKEPMDVRQQWTHDNEDLILECAQDPTQQLWWATDADSPFCFLAACMEFRKWKLSENPKEYRCGIAVAFDGSCSGIQHFSCMLRDEQGGFAVNLIPSDRPQDIYRIVADKVKIMIEDDLRNGSDAITVAEADEETGEITERIVYGTKDAARWWLDHGITRKVTKRSVMTLPYGSKKFGFADQLLEDIIWPFSQEHGEHAFPAPGAAARYMAAHIWTALETTVVAATEAMAWLQKAAGALASQDMPCTWVTPVGFPVWHDYRKRNQKRIDTVICGGIRLTMTVDKDEGSEAPVMDRTKQVSAISPNFVHSMDASHLMLTALDAHDKGVESFAMIHDSFGTCPGTAGIMFDSVREVMVSTYTENDVIRGFYDGFAADLTDQNADKIPQLPEKGNLDLEGIIRSSYCFC